jgi:hypothetical protein
MRIEGAAPNGVFAAIAGVACEKRHAAPNAQSPFKKNQQAFAMGLVAAAAAATAAAVACSLVSPAALSASK